MGCALARLGQCLAHVKILGRSTPQRPRYSMPKKCTFSGSILTCNSKPLVDQSSRDFFVKRRRNCHSSYCFPILDIFSRSGDIRDQSLKWSKIDRNFACFWPPIFWGDAPPSFWNGIIKFSQIPTTWQSFRVIRRGSSENEWRNKKRYITGKT